jgi:hypothetical protein
VIELKDKTKSGQILRGSGASKPTTLGSVLVAIIGSAVCLFIVLAATEFVFALCHVGEDTVAKPDPLLGYSHLRKQTITFRSEGYSRSTINARGFRDGMYAVPKPAGTYRVCVVGDSMTMGLEVPLESTYPKLLEKQLRAQGKNAEVINCGMSGTGTGQQLLGFRKNIAPLQPDMLIVGYHLGDNDDNVGGGTNPPRPTFKIDPDRNLSVEFKDIDTWLAGEQSRFYSSFDWFRRNSRILAVLSKMDLDLHQDKTYQMLSNLWSKPGALLWNTFLRTLPAGDWHLAQSRDVAADLLPGVKNALPATPMPAPVPVALQPLPAPANQQLEHGQQNIELYRGSLYVHLNRMAVTLEILKHLNQDCRNRNCKLVVVGLPAYDNTMMYYRELNEIRQLASQTGFTYLDAWQSYPARGPLDESPYHFSTHFNCAGHIRMCEFLMKNLFAKFVLTSPLSFD